tara:strand:- start:3570 stop:4901 length:1332 start_codon:yes stop_codon:yes gene_type:complete
MSTSDSFETCHAEVYNLLSRESCVKAMLQFESALAQAEAKVGLIPDSAASAISDVCKQAQFDLDSLEQRASRAGTLVIPFAKDLTALVQEASPKAAGFVHMGATSQDVLDSSLNLQLKKVLKILSQGLIRIETALSNLARDHTETLMLGRTLLQAGPPISFGIKTANWAASIRRGRTRIKSAAEDALLLQFGGAVGTLSSLKKDGQQVASELAATLGLNLPRAPWHTQRDRLTHLMGALAILVGSLGKVARDISLMMQNEIAELSEPGGEGRGGSSAMRHKQNPVGSMAVLSAANRIPGLHASLLSGMVQEHERGLGGWQAEWLTIPEILRETSKATFAMVEVTEGLQVHPQKMQANLEVTNEVVYSEHLAAALRTCMGREEANSLVAQLVEGAVASNLKLSDVAAGNATVSNHLKEAELKAIFDPANAMGDSRGMMDRLLDE